MRGLWSWVFAGICAMALGACASTPTEPTLGAALSGRLSVQMPADGAEAARGFSAQFDLRGSAAEGSLELSGPLGLGSVRADWSAGRYRLDNGQGVREFSSLDEMTQVGLGEPLPLVALFDWLKGRPWPGAPFKAFDNRPGAFEQLGWRIDAGDPAKGRLRAQRLTPPHVQLRIALEVQEPS